MINGRFYDASAYRADPRPMALEPDTVYEALRSGEPVGLFTLTNAMTVANDWYGLGQWKAKGAPEAEQKPAAAATPKPLEDDAPPVLHRPKAQASTPPAPKPAEDDDRPVLQKPRAESKPEAAPAEAKPAEAATKAEAKAAPAPSEDSDRPVLRRGKSAEKGAWNETDPFTAPKAGAKPGLAGVSGTAESVETLTAISDAAGPEPHSFVMEASAEERQQYEAKVRADLYEAVRKFAAARPQHKPGPVTALRDVQFRVLDVHHNNEPLLVMSASLPETAGASNFQYFVTVVARIDMYGDLRRLFAQVSDSSHLDVYRRMELIDAVDAQGSGGGQLLFRAVGDGDYRYALYRVGSDQLWPLFESPSQSN